MDTLKQFPALLGQLEAIAAFLGELPQTNFGLFSLSGMASIDLSEGVAGTLVDEEEDDEAYEDGYFGDGSVAVFLVSLEVIDCFGHDICIYPELAVLQ